jgi:hypothetical protein
MIFKFLAYDFHLFSCGSLFFVIKTFVRHFALP